MMKKNPSPLERLNNALKVLPGVGPKTAQRMAYHLLQHDRQGAENLASAISDALKQVHHCRLCNTFCEDDLCAICADTSRQHDTLMVVAMPIDIAGMEDAHCHQGLYFVLMGLVDPTQNADVDFIAIQRLKERIRQDPDLKEIILATGFTAEGDATAYIVQESIKDLPITISRLAKGIPLGGELEYIDAGTLAQAVYERKIIQKSD